MQPENAEPLIGPNGGPEQLPTPPPSEGERIPLLPPAQEGVQQGAERREHVGEAHAAASDMAVSSAPVVPAAVSATPEPQAGFTVDTATTGPLVAGDEEVIEKEWVDKAKQILNETKDDPFKRSNQVNELQKDYLKKRYGKELGGQ